MTKPPEWAAAHTPRKDDPAQRWQPLRDHLEAVAEDAQRFAQHFAVPHASETLLITCLMYFFGITLK